MELGEFSFQMPVDNFYLAQFENLKFRVIVDLWHALVLCVNVLLNIG